MSNVSKNKDYKNSISIPYRKDPYPVDEYKAIRWIRNISNTKVNDGISLKNILDWEGISLWWFFDIPLYSKINDLVIKNFQKTKKNTMSSLSSLTRYYILAKILIRFFLGHLVTCRKNSNTPKILCISYTVNWKDSINPCSNKPKNDLMLGGIIDALEKEGFVVTALDQDCRFLVDFRNFHEKALYTKGTWKPVETYLTFDAVRKSCNAGKKFGDEWNKLQNNQNFIESLKYNNLLLFDLLKEDFEKLFKYKTFEAVLYIELVKRAIEIEKPNLILMTYEYGALGKSTVIAGKLKGIPTVAVQHGVITPTHKGYMYSKNEILPDGSAKLPYYPIPEKTAVSGYYYKYLLTKVSGYPENSVVLTGQPRYDILYYADKIYDKKQVFKELKISPDKKLVLWTTQTHGFPLDENKKNISAVYNAIKSFRNIQLVIKLHPNENQKATLYKKDRTFKPLIMSGKANTYALLYACDLLITKHSTTAAEAIALNKPVIILNLSGMEDVVDYVKEGVATGVYNEKDLKQKIEQLLRNDAELRKNRKRYVEKHLYKIDGKATERIVNLIKKTIKEH